MNLSSLPFLFIFLPAVLALYFAFRRLGVRWGNWVLLAASIVFYAWGEPQFVYALIAMALVNWVLALVLSPGHEEVFRKTVFIVMLILDIGLLFVFKYLGFVYGGILSVIGSEPALLSFALPLGISFFVFSMISYAIDVYTGKIFPAQRLDDFCLCVLFFPKIAVGPIARYSEMGDDLVLRHASADDFSKGIGLFIVGFGKKVFFADRLGIVADNLFLLAEDGVPLSFATAWIGLVAYSLQIYFDFSGYSDMAIGVCRLFGFRIGKNFNYPYAATSVTDFWRRWHMSLSSWFRDYVYIPLGGNRCSRGRVVINLFVVWVLTGVWHGANWTFILWGGLYFVFLMLERLLGLAKPERLSPLKKLAMRGWSLFVVALCWAVFRSSSLSDAINYLGLLFGSAGVFFDAMAESYLLNGGGVLVFAAVCAFPVSNALETFAIRGRFRPVFPIVRIVFLAVTLVISVLMCFKSGHNPSIYFQF